MNLPDIIDFNNFSEGIACIEATKKYYVLLYKLRSSHLSAEILLEPIKDILIDMVSSEYIVETKRISNINMDLMISRIDDPLINSISKCLSDILLKKQNEIILDPNKIVQEKKLTDASEDRIKELMNLYFTSDSNITSANLIVQKSLSQFFNLQDLELFQLIDKLLSYLSLTKYIETFNEINSVYSCLKDNCINYKELTPFDFLWTDINHTEFIMPIDINNGKISFRKFFLYNTKEEEKRLNNIEIRYFKYIDSKKELLRLGSSSIKNKDNNPFENMLNEMITNKDIVNTLF